jgi:multisubunit Na+/H+ antiporter MnhE subunit
MVIIIAVAILVTFEKYLTSNNFTLSYSLLFLLFPYFLKTYIKAK